MITLTIEQIAEKFGVAPDEIIIKGFINEKKAMEQVYYSFPDCKITVLEKDGVEFKLKP